MTWKDSNIMVKTFMVCVCVFLASCTINCSYMELRPLFTECGESPKFNLEIKNER